MQFRDILKAYLIKEQIKCDNIEELKKLYNISVEQNLQPILYLTLKEKTLKKYYISWVIMQEHFTQLQNEITNLFNTNQINHIYFKGSVLSNIYDDPSIRTRGDIDVFINIEDLEKAKALLIDNGYVYDEKMIGTHNIDFTKNNILIELHFNLFDEEVSKRWQKYFSLPFELSDKTSECKYDLRPTEHFLYCLCHFAKHLLKGAGLRYVLDFYYMLKNTNINYELLHERLKSLDLYKLFNNILNVIYYFTNESFDEFEKVDIEYFIDYMEISGVHGFGKENDANINQGLSRGKAGFIKNMIFLTEKNYRKAKYPRLGSKKILYPICLIVHWFKLVFTGLFRRIKLLCIVLFKKNNKKDLYKKLGI